MTDRPIIFSGAMVRALLDGRKTQTRRLATSPLAKSVAGDRLYARETWSHSGIGVWTIADARRMMDGKPLYRATNVGFEPLRWWPSIHMPREFSRLTLIVEAVRVEPLQAISEADAFAEGLMYRRMDGPGGLWVNVWHWLADVDDEETYGSAVSAYRALWSSLHTKPGQRWEDNPQVLVLTFRVERSNIDAPPPPKAA